ncbi:hypothetical protein ES332_A02G049300v1 [Gossypium tomentosum]|uniref:Uncharacterized protein n=1 Tax=Gossypium tomentosum TaxID=34277 RepID=A0A5D2RGP1_GOSTO|nr:hypothetical protein ES332_A02G049300v1 [Gossypium tomentosum]
MYKSLYPLERHNFLNLILKPPFPFIYLSKKLLIFKLPFLKKKKPLICSVRVGSAHCRQTTISSMADGAKYQTLPTGVVTTKIWYGCAGT